MAKSYSLESLEWRTLQFVADQVFSKAETLGADALSMNERAFWIAWIADGHICGGTIYRLFHLCPELVDSLVDAYQRLQMPEKAEFIRDMMALLPEPHPDEDERLAQVSAIQQDDPERDEEIQKLHGMYYDGKESFDQCSYEFVMEHRAEFLAEE